MNDSFVHLKDGRKLGYVDYGSPDGIPIFLFHGTPGSRIWFSGDEPFIKKHNVRIITPERPGCGLSDVKKDRTMLDWADDVFELSKHLGISKFHVAGVSGGGPYTLACAAKLPGQILSATLIASGAPSDTPNYYKGMAFNNKMIFFLMKYFPLVLKPLYYTSYKYLMKHPDKFLDQIDSQLCEWDKKVVETIKQNGEDKLFVTHTVEAYRSGIDGVMTDTRLLAEPWGINYKKISVPIFIWHGTSDTLSPMAGSKYLSELIPASELRLVPGAGHLLLEDEKIANEILDTILKLNN